MLAPELFEELARQGLDVGGTIPQGRDVDRHGAHSVVEVRAKASLIDEGREIGVRGGDESKVDGLLLGGPDRPDPSRLECAQELRLDRERELTDLVQEQRASVRGGEGSLTGPRGARERSAKVTEELALGERFGDRRAVERDERSLRTRAEQVQATCEQVLPRSRLPLEDRREIDGCEAMHVVQNLDDGRARSDETGQGPGLASRDEAHAPDGARRLGPGSIHGSAPVAPCRPKSRQNLSSSSS